MDDLLGYGGNAEIRSCRDCNLPYPDFSSSSHITCWICRIKVEPCNEPNCILSGKLLSHIHTVSQPFQISED